MTSHYDLAVIGAGVEGSWTALQAVKSLHGARVLLLEQFPLPHTRGSSHGQSRIIRHAYAESFHAELMPRAFSEWRQLEKDTGRALLVNMPLLCVGDESGYASLKATIASLRHVLPSGEGTQYRELASAELRKEFPQATFTDKHYGVLENCAGLLRADRCLEAIQTRFQTLGGIIQDCSPVTSLNMDGPRVRINLSQKSYVTANKVAICAGAWSSKLLDPLMHIKLPLKPLRVNVYYWRIKKDGPGAIKTSYIDFGDGHEFWGVPEFEYPGMVKLCSHREERCDPDARDETKTHLDFSRIVDYIKKRFPGLELEPAIKETCVYTMTPDEISIIDYVTGNKKIAFACGFSGTGFKKAPEVGRILVQMLTSEYTTYDVKPFSLSRFININAAKL